MPASRIAARLVASLLAIAGFALAAAIVGAAFGATWGWALFASLVLVALLMHLRNLLVLARWLEAGSSLEPPRVVGVWDELHALLHRSRRQAAQREADLARALSRWREAARALPDGVVILDEDRIAWCNDTARSHLEVDPGRDVGRVITHLVRIPEFVEYLEQADHSKPVQVRAPDMRRLLSIQVIEYGERQRLVLSRDITQFENVERMRREFVANVSHELRTPLTVISGFLEMLREEKDPARARKHLDLMTEQAARMERLVADLLTLSQLESSPPPQMDETIDMEALLGRLEAEARALSGGRHRIEASADRGVTLVGSEAELASAFGNLVSNAIRYTPEGGTVRLAWKAANGGAEFEVEDDGIGIPAEHISRLTERFYRVDRGRSRETGGTGLGLAIVKHALTRHGATLHVASTPGRGSRFSARFSDLRVRKGDGNVVEEPGRGV